MTSEPEVSREYDPGPEKGGFDYLLCRGRVQLEVVEGRRPVSLNAHGTGRRSTKGEKQGSRFSVQTTSDRSREVIRTKCSLVIKRTFDAA